MNGESYKMPEFDSVALIPEEKIRALNPTEKTEYFAKLTALKKRINAEYAILADELLQATKDLGIRSLKTDNYTLSRAKKISFKVIDLESAKADLASRSMPVKTVSVEQFDDPTMNMLKEYYKAKENSKEVCEEDPSDIKGIEKSHSEYITVRINK